MMRTIVNNKKRPSSPAALTPKQKKRKRTTYNTALPTPHHITINNEGLVLYHFEAEKAAQNFLGQLQSNPDLRKTNIAQTKMVFTRSSYDAKLYSTVDLTSEQIDALFGEEAYHHFQEIYKITCDENTADIMVKNLVQLNTVLLNQVSLLRDDDDGVCSLHLAAMGNKNDFMKLIKLLRTETCNQAALLRNEEEQSIVTTLAYSDSIESFMDFVGRLNADVRVESVLLPTKKGDCALELIGKNSQSESTWLKLISLISEHPDAIKKITEKIPHLKKLHLFDGGKSRDSWSSIAKSIISLAPKVKKRKRDFDLPEKMREIKSRRLASKGNIIRNLTRRGWRFLRMQGRTVLLIDKINRNIYALKIKKQNESREELIKEYNTTLYFREHSKELKLKSDFPLPIGVSHVSGLLELIKPELSSYDFETMKEKIGDHSSHLVYLYQVDNKKCDYFTYLHDPSLSDAAFKAGNDKAVYDLFTLLCKGVVFPQLADIFHNTEHVNEREDKGRYMVLVNLLRDIGELGAGRLTGWKKAVEYPNVRGSGLADLGDRASLNDYIAEGSQAKTYYQETLNAYGKKASNYLVANIMAEYQYVLFLIAGRRGCDLTEQVQKNALSLEEVETQIKKIWDKLAWQIVRNCAQALSIVTYQSETQAQQFLSSIVNVERLSRQMRYWMTDEHIANTRCNKIPDDIYGKNVKVKIDFDAFRENTFNLKLGFSLDGINSDLGPVNGQEPIKEANKLFYWMVSSGFNSYHQVNLSLKDIRAITNEKDLIKSEALRLQSFAHLPEKSYHVIQLELCHERLKQSAPLPPDMIEKIGSEARKHERSHAALTILNFWRAKKAGRVIRKTSGMEDKHEVKIKAK